MNTVDTSVPSKKRGALSSLYIAAVDEGSGWEIANEDCHIYAAEVVGKLERS